MRVSRTEISAGPQTFPCEPLGFPCESLASISSFIPTYTAGLSHTALGTVVQPFLVPATDLLPGIAHPTAHWHCHSAFSLFVPSASPFKAFREPSGRVTLSSLASAYHGLHLCLRFSLILNLNFCYPQLLQNPCRQNCALLLLALVNLSSVESPCLLFDE